jgi:hypothetical protein
MCCRKHDYDLCEACVAIGRDQANLVRNHGKARAIEIFLDRGMIKRVRYANLSVINAGPSEGKMIRCVRELAKVELIEWPRPVDHDYRGRPFFQEVDGRVVIKIQREGHQRDVSR